MLDRRMQRAKINAMSSLAHQLISTVCGIIIPWIMIDTYGSSAYGATTSIAQFLSYIALFEGGIGRVARGALYEPLAQGDSDNISRVYLAIKRFFSVLGIIFAAYSVVLAFCYYDIADIKEFSRNYVFMLVLAISIGKFAEYMGGISNITLLNADQKQYIVVSGYIVTGILNVIAIVILTRLGCDILWVKLTGSFVFILKPVLYSVYVSRKYKINKKVTSVKLKNKSTGIAQHLAYVIQNNTDVLILTVLADLKTVAVYSVYNLVVNSVKNIATSFTGGMEAFFGNMIAKGEKKALKDAYNNYKFILTVLTCVLFSSTAILIVPFVKLYTSGVSDANYDAPVFGLILTISAAINCLVWPCFNLTIAGNLLKESKFGAYGEAAINLIASILLVFWNPLAGVATGTLLSSVYKGVFYIVFSGKKVLHIKTSGMLYKFAASVIVLSAMSVIGMLLIDRLRIENFGVWILIAVVVVLITGVSGLLFGCCLYPGCCKTFLKNVFLKKKESASCMYDEYTKHDIAAYAGYIRDEDELMQCSSGGVATAFARKMIDDGGYVAGVVYSDDFLRAEYRIISNNEGIEKLKGSKYIEVNNGRIFSQVKELLESGKKVLFIGLPCTVAALHGFIKKDYDSLITVELICHGPTSVKVHRNYIEHLQNKFDGKIVDFSVKRKKDSWTPGYLYAEFDNGKTFSEEFYHTEYGYAFAVMAKKQCYSCKFRGNNRTGDIMIGDFWGANENDSFWNKKGVSAILVHNEKGLQWLKSNNELQLFETSFERIVEKNQNIIKPRSRREETSRFEQLLAEHDLFYAVKHSKKTITKIKGVIKRFIKI